MLPGSVLSCKSSGISGVQVPWLYIGMCFSSFCWHVEDHHFNFVNYMHFGAPKVWYCVPMKAATKFEEAMRKHLPDLFEEQPDLLHKLITQLSPNILKSKGVPVFRCVQNPGEFVVTFPRAYHCGFNTGFNCAEAMNVAPLNWIPHGQIAVDLYHEQRRKTISHDKLLLGAAREVVKANWERELLKRESNSRWKDADGSNGILTKSLWERVELERVRRDFLCQSFKALKMDSSFDESTERECCECFFDLDLSAVGCDCSPDRFACLNHAKELCPCSLHAKVFLFRYDIRELHILIEAVEGKFQPLYKWAKDYLGLSLDSYHRKIVQVSRCDRSHQKSVGTNLQSQTDELQPSASVLGPSHLHFSREDGSCSQGSNNVRSLELTGGQHDVICLSDNKDDEPKASDAILGSGQKFNSLNESSASVLGPSQLHVAREDEMSQASNARTLELTGGQHDVICLTDNKDDQPKASSSDAVLGSGQNFNILNEGLADDAALGGGGDGLISSSAGDGSIGSPDPLSAEDTMCAESETFLPLWNLQQDLCGNPALASSGTSRNVQDNSFSERWSSQGGWLSNAAGEPISRGIRDETLVVHKRDMRIDDVTAVPGSQCPLTRISHSFLQSPIPHSREDETTATNRQPTAHVNPILHGLFAKANMEELCTLFEVLGGDGAAAANSGLVIELLKEEIRKHSR